MAHSTSLRATGSLIDRCSSVACEVLPWRARVTARWTAATSAPETAATAIGAGGGAALTAALAVVAPVLGDLDLLAPFAAIPPFLGSAFAGLAAVVVVLLALLFALAGSLA